MDCRQYLPVNCIVKILEHATVDIGLYKQGFKSPSVHTMFHSTLDETIMKISACNIRFHLLPKIPRILLRFDSYESTVEELRL